MSLFSVSYSRVARFIGNLQIVQYPLPNREDYQISVVNLCKLLAPTGEIELLVNQ